MKNKKKQSWREYFKQIRLDNAKEGYGKDCYWGYDEEWHLEDIADYLKKIEKLGITNIEMPDNGTTVLNLSSKDQTEALLYIMATAKVKPYEIKFNKKKRQLILSWG